VVSRRIKLRRAVSRLAIGLLLLLVIALAVPVAAGSMVTGTFSVIIIASNVSASNIGIDHADIAWDTNGDATSQVCYDTYSHENIADYAHQGNIDFALISHHSTQLTGLSSSTTYHYRVKSVSRVYGTEFIVISEDYTFRTKSRISGGGGGGGSPTLTLALAEAAGVTSSNIIIDSTGTALTGGQITTLDGKLSITVNTGTQLLDIAGQPLTSLTVSIPSSPVPPLLPVVIILAYDIGPGGATFTPPITLTMNYNPATLPAGVVESTLYIAYWDGSAWQALPSTVDTRVKTVTASLAHFTIFALMGQVISAPTPTPVPTPVPALTPTPTSTPTPTPTLTPTTTATPVFTPTPVPTSSSTPGFIGALARWWLILIFISLAAGIVLVIVLFIFRRRNK
jgi:hypothetical protein